MNKHPFFSRLKRTSLAVGKCLLIIAGAVSAASAQSAPEVDLSVGIVRRGIGTNDTTGYIRFWVTVLIQGSDSPAKATGTILRVALPSGAVPVAGETFVVDRDIFPSNELECDFADGILTCDLAEVTAGNLGKSKTLFLAVKPASSGDFGLSAWVTTDEIETRYDNNIASYTTRPVPAPKSLKKRVRIF